MESNYLVHILKPGGEGDRGTRWRDIRTERVDSAVAWRKASANTSGMGRRAIAHRFGVSTTVVFRGVRGEARGVGCALAMRGLVGLGALGMLGAVTGCGTIGETAPGAKFTINSDPAGVFYEIYEGNLPVLRYNHGTVPPPAGIEAKLARGDYIHPLYGLQGETLTADYPKDHPHHRGVWWSWPVTRLGSEVRDIWAVRGVWARPVGVRVEAGGGRIEAESEWRWGDEKAIVKEVVIIRAQPRNARGRMVDVEVRLTALVEGVAIGGRPQGGYGGFALRAAAVKEQAIVARWDPPEAQPRRSWIDFSGVVGGAAERAGVTIFEHPENPGYPSPHRNYPNLNCIMPAFPDEREVPLPRGTPLVLRHRLWIHGPETSEPLLAAVWADYANPESRKGAIP